MPQRGKSKGTSMIFDFKGEVENPWLMLNKIEYQYILDILLPAQSLDARYGQYLVPNPLGIYTTHQVLPVIRPDQKVYRSDNGEEVEFSKILDMTCNIIGKDGETIIPASMLKNKKHFLSMTGFYPVSAIGIIKTRICEIIEQNLNYVFAYMCNYNVQRYIKGLNENDPSAVEFYERLVPEGTIDDFMPEIIDDILAIAKDYPWHIHSVDFRSTNAYINRLTDYRIFDWTCQKWQEQNKDNE